MTEMELGRTNMVAPQETANGTVIDINDEDEKVLKDDTIEKHDEREGNDKSSDSSVQDDADDEDNENATLGYCRFVVKHHRLTFGMSISFNNQ